MNPEFVGIIATIVLVWSLCLSDIVSLRVLGIVSNLLFIVYSMMFDPVLVSILITNVLIFGVHVYKLMEIYYDRRRSEHSKS